MDPNHNHWAILGFLRVSAGRRIWYGALGARPEIIYRVSYRCRIITVGTVKLPHVNMDPRTKLHSTSLQRLSCSHPAQSKRPCFNIKLAQRRKTHDCRDDLPFEQERMEIREMILHSGVINFINSQSLHISPFCHLTIRVDFFALLDWCRDTMLKLDPGWQQYQRPSTAFC